MEGLGPAWQGFGPSKPSPLMVLDSSGRIWGHVDSRTIGLAIMSLA